MAQEKDDNLLRTDIQTLYSLHLGFAVDEMHEATELMKSPNESNNGMRARRLTISSILHAFCSFEALVNYLGYNRFFYHDSKAYLPEIERDYLLNRQLNSWNWIKLIDRINLLFLSYNKNILDKNLESRITEFNNLRNRIAHGETYHTITLIKPMPDLPPGQGYFIIDEEISKNGNKNYPHCKFKALHHLDEEDAKIALRIVIEVFQMLSVLTGNNLRFETYYPFFLPTEFGWCESTANSIDAILRI
jgi:hypothetical protein